MRNDTKADRILYVLGIIPVIWLALLIAPHVNGGIIEIIKQFPIVMEKPLSITFCENSTKVMLIFMLIYGIAIGLYESNKKNYRRKEEHGSAKWGNAHSLNKKYKQNPISENKILTQNVAIGLDGRKHRRNLNVLVCGRKWSRKNKILSVNLM